MTFADMLRDAMVKQGFTARALSERIGLRSLHGVFKWRSGERTPELPTLRRIVEVLDLPRREAFLAAWPAARWFLEEESEEQRPEPGSAAP